MGSLRVLPAHVPPQNKKFQVCCAQGHNVCPLSCHWLCSELALLSGQKTQTVFSHTCNAAHSVPHGTRSWIRAALHFLRFCFILP